VLREGNLLVDARVTIIALTEAGRAARLPALLRAALETRRP
jgi:acyl-CoA thioesterase FadM